MTRIDFHSKVGDKLQFACRLLRKACNEGWPVIVHCDDEAQLQALDRALWTFSDHDFLPHVRVDDELASVTPILLCSDDQTELPHHRLLVNVSSSTHAHFARFERLVEIVSSDEQDLAAGRARFTHYKARGYQLNHYDRSGE